MALNYLSHYPNQIASDPTNYPYGKARNVTVSGDGTGTPWEQDLLNDIFGFHQALLVKAGITPNDSPDTAIASQLLDALAAAIPNRIVAQGSRTGAIGFNWSSSTAAQIIGIEMSVTGMKTNDIMEGEYLLRVTLAAGHTTIKLYCSDNQGIIDAPEYYVAAPGGPIVIPFRYVAAHDGLVGVIPWIIGDNVNAATVNPYCYSSGLYCRYKVIRP